MYVRTGIAYPCSITIGFHLRYHGLHDNDRLTIFIIHGEGHQAAGSKTQVDIHGILYYLYLDPYDPYIMIMFV